MENEYKKGFLSRPLTEETLYTKTKLNYSILGISQSLSVQCKGTDKTFSDKQKSTKISFLPINRRTLTSFVEESLKNLFVAIADGDICLLEDNSSTVDNPNFVLPDDVGAVHSYEMAGG